MRSWLKEKHSSEAKSSEEECHCLLFARVWFFDVGATKNPWSFSTVRISPSLMSKGGFKTVITHGRFRAFLIGGTNSRQNWEFTLPRKTFRARAYMFLKRAYFAHCIKQDKFAYIIGGRGDLNAKSYYNFIKSQCTMERYDIEKNKWELMKVRLNEGRYHASATMVNDRYIYVFGGY